MADTCCFAPYFTYDGMNANSHKFFVQTTPIFTGASKKFTLSFWVNFQSSIQDSAWLLQQGDVTASPIGNFLFLFQKIVGNFLYIPTIQLFEGTTMRASWASNTVVPPPAVWQHYLISVDCTGGSLRGQVYLNDVLQPAFSILNAATTKLNLDDAKFTIGRRLKSTSYEWEFGFLGGLSCLWMCCDESIDLSITANRRKFISATGFPVDLGLDGTLPGVIPHLWLRNNSASSWGVNYGSAGGQFGAANAPFARFATNPSGCVAPTRILHNALRANDLHEPKGVVAATADALLVSDGAGSGAWQVCPQASTKSSGGAVTLVTPTEWTPSGMGVTTSIREVGVTDATGPKITSTNTRPHTVEASYEITMSQNSGGDEDLYVTWSKNGVAQEQGTQIKKRGTTGVAAFSSKALFRLALNDTLEVVVKVAAGDILVQNCHVSLQALPSQE